MKPIQILVLVAATATAALGQNTSSTPQTTGSSGQPSATAKTTQKSAAGAPSTKMKSSGAASQTSGSTSQTPTVKLIVPKAGTRTAASSAKSTATTSSGQGSAAHGPAMTTAHPAGKPAVSQKTPVLTVKPVQKPGTNGKNAKVAVAEKKAPEKTPHTREESPVAIVPQKPAAGNKTAPGVEDSTMAANGRRDPFISVIRAIPSGPGGPTCSVGKRCLFIPDLELKGIAKDTDGQMMAVVVSNTHRAYFLRENDQVFNGSVQKITSDSVIFREFATDRLGRETAHEVVKKLART